MDAQVPDRAELDDLQARAASGQILPSEAAVIQERLTSALRTVDQSPAQQGVKQQLIQTMRTIRGIAKEAVATAVQVSPGDRLKRVLEGIDVREQFKHDFYECFIGLPPQYQERYLERRNFDSIGKNPDPVARDAAMSAALFELTRQAILLNQGKETVVEQAPKIKVAYNGFTDYPLVLRADESLLADQTDLRAKLEAAYVYDAEAKQWTFKTGGKPRDAQSLFEKPEMHVFLKPLYEQDPAQRKTSDIEFDVPVEREGKPFIYEAKKYPRRIYGQLVAHRNQLLKYQHAVSEGSVAGATVEIAGRIDSEFLAWCAGRSIDDLGAVPDIEIVYTLPLPSGREYRFVLKRARAGGLRFSNGDREYTPEDRKVIRGLQEAIVSRKVYRMLSTLREQDFGEETRTYLAKPHTITDPAVFARYEQEQLQSLWKQCEEEVELHRVNRGNKQNAYAENEDATRTALDDILTKFQTFLHQNPHAAKSKEAYLLQLEEIPAVLEEAVRMAGLVRAAELPRFEALRTPGTDEEQRAGKRRRFGYRGLPEGVALDLEHILLDAILSKKAGKKARGRSYEKPERFKDIAEVVRSVVPTLSSSRTVIATVYDAASGQSQQQRGIKAVEKLESALLDENIGRLKAKAEEMLGGTGSTGLNGKRQQWQGAQRMLQELTELEGQNAGRLTEMRQQIETQARGVKSKPDFGPLKQLANELTANVLTRKRELEQQLATIIGGWETYERTLRKRVVKVVDQDLSKFIYAVSPDEKILTDKELLGSDISGRAAHSELTQGRNSYGAGEFVFSKHNFQCESLNEWKQWVEQHYDEKAPWVLTEINNGSGHFRPDGSTLFYVKGLLQERGIDVSHAVLRDCLGRGAHLVEAEIFGDDEEEATSSDEQLSQ